MVRIATLCMVLALSGTAGAEVLKLSLRDTLSLALEKNDRVLISSHRAEAAAKGVSIARSAYLPTIGVEETFSASDSPTRTFMMKLDQGRFRQEDFRLGNLNSPGAYHDFQTSLVARLPLFDPSIAPSAEMASRDAEAEKLNLASSRQEVAFQVYRLFLEVKSAAAQQAAAEKGVLEARESLRLARVRGEAGTGLKSDELRARTHLSAAEQRQIASYNSLLIAQMRLGLVAGLGEGGRIEPVGEAPALSVGATRESLLGQARNSRSDLAGRRAELEKAEAALSRATRAYLPTMNGFAGYQRNDRDLPFGGDNDSWMAGVTLQWEVFDGFRRERSREQAALLRSAAIESLRESEREAAFQVQESLLRRDEMGKRLEVARHALLDAEESVRLLRLRFENSMATMHELLDAQAALNRTRSDLVETEAGYGLAGARVYHATGTLLEEILK